MIVCRFFGSARSAGLLPVGTYRGSTRYWGAYNAVRPAQEAVGKERQAANSKLWLRRGPRRGPDQPADPDRLGTDRVRPGPGDEDPQATATGRAFADVDEKQAGEQGGPPQPMAAGRGSRSTVRSRQRSNRLRGHDPVAVSGTGRQDTLVS